MEKSDSIKNIATALCKFQGEMGAIGKDASNPFFKSKFASLSKIIEETRAPLAANGLSYVQFPHGDSELITMLMHVSGEWMLDGYKITPVDQKPQSIGSALSYGRRYALCSILGLQVDDDDGNEASKPKRKYDTTPVKENAPVMVTGADDINEIVPSTTKKKAPTFEDKRREIKDLADSISSTMLVTKDDYALWVKKTTGLELTPPNFDPIIERLTAIK